MFFVWNLLAFLPTQPAFKMYCTVATYCKSWCVSHGCSSRSTWRMLESSVNSTEQIKCCIWMSNTYDSLKNHPGLCTNEVIKYKEMRGGKWVWAQGKILKVSTCYLPLNPCQRQAGENLRLKSSIPPSFIQITVILDNFAAHYVQCQHLVWMQKGKIWFSYILYNILCCKGCWGQDGDWVHSMFVFDTGDLSLIIFY